MHSSDYETSLHRLDALDALVGFNSLETLYEFLKPTSLDPDLRLIGMLAFAGTDLLSDEQFRKVASSAVADALMPAAVYTVWDGGGDDGDCIAAMEECREKARRLAELAVKASSARIQE